jgi:ABC-type uncharacterized transport system substrate-binding protein
MVLTGLPIYCHAENLRVLVLLSDGSTPYQSFGNYLTSKLPATIQVSIQNEPEKAEVHKQADLIVAVGMKAALAATTESHIPVLAAMITKGGYEELLAQASEGKLYQAISAIYLDQPLDRQIAFIQAAIPRHRRIGLLYSPNGRFNMNFLRQKIADHGELLVAKPVLSAVKLFSTLDDLLENCDVLLAVPDNTIYNGVNIRNILLSTYRSGIPFIGLSQSYVTAGAIGAVFTSPEQVADQVASTIIGFTSSRALPAPQYPQEFTLSLNTEVARSLSIELQSIDTIRLRMNSAEGGAP